VNNDFLTHYIAW